MGGCLTGVSVRFVHWRQESSWPRSRIIAALVAFGVAAAILAPATASQTVRQCDESSWVAGTTEWCNGEFVYRDYVYDDFGADDPVSTTNQSAGGPTPVGDVDHTQHGQTRNSADLLVLRVRREGKYLVARFDLDTLFPTDRTIAALAVDVDDSTDTGGGDWGVVSVRSEGWDVVAAFDGRDPETNVIEGRIALPEARTGVIRLQAVVALGDGTPMNVAFRTGERGDWWDERQALALAAGDISEFGVRVSVAGFGERHEPAHVEEPGFYERVYRSAYPLGEGVDPAGVEPGARDQLHWPTTVNYLGTHQPYGLYIPSGPGPYGVQLMLHGAGGNHSFHGGWAPVFGNQEHRILVAPLGRGPNNGWVDWGVRDAVDALADAQEHYPIDPDAVFVSGYSMGGTGAIFLAISFPDRFAAVLDWVGHVGDCLNGTPLAQGRQRPPATEALGPYDPSGQFSNSPERYSGCPLGERGNSLDYLENLRHLPSAYLYGIADEFGGGGTGPYAVAKRMAELGYEHRWWDHAGDHVTWAGLQDWRMEGAWSHGRRRAHQPARVTYRTNSWLSMPMVDLIPDGAYWVDEMKPRNGAYTPDGDMMVDLTSHACPADSERTVEIRYDAGTEPLPWVGQEGVPTGVGRVEPGAYISGTITNVKEVTIEVEEACFQKKAEIALDISVDGPTLVRFTDGRPARLLVQAEE